MEEKELAKIMEEVAEEIERAKQRILWKLAEKKDLHKSGMDEEWRPVRNYERGFFSLD